MSDSDLAISVRGLGKSYAIRHQQRPAHTTLAESIMHRLRHPFAGAGTNGRETFWALKDVSFDIRRGEVVGIIGRNGAGKSTLLKVLSRITEPTTGEIDLWGRVGSLLEVGTGFHQELTGRENIFLNGSILGMTGAEIRRQFDAIVDFAGVDQFLDTPVKRYSSGMYVRLAFAVAAHLRSEILIIDEVLAVGDAEFQKKCVSAMHRAAEGGRTVLLVSHNLGVVSQLCNTAILLHLGEAIARGGVHDVLRAYEEMQSGVEDEAIWRNLEAPQDSDAEAWMETAEVVDVDGERRSSFLNTEPVRVQFRVTVRRPHPLMKVGFDLVRNGTVLFRSHHADAVVDPEPLLAGRNVVTCEIPAFFL